MNVVRQAVKVTFAFLLAFVFVFSNLTAMSLPNIVMTTDIGNQAKGTLKRAEGKAQQTIGNLTGDREAQIKGKVKQAEGQIRSSSAAKTEDQIIGETQQAESNIRRYQSDDYRTSNPIQAIQH